jgi:hypothetical protein
LLITLLILIPTALKPQGEDKLPLKQAAFWINVNKNKPFPIIMSNEPSVGYYAGGKNLFVPTLGYPEFGDYIDARQVDHVGFSERNIIKEFFFYHCFNRKNLKELILGIRRFCFMKSHAKGNGEYFKNRPHDFFGLRLTERYSWENSADF